MPPMKFVLSTGINPQHQLTELALMRLAVAIRASVGFSKKVVFKLMVEMKNGCLWLCYTVNGVKCSTFVRASVFASLLLNAKYQLAQVMSDYVQSLRSKFHQVGISYDADDNSIRLTISINGKAKDYYLLDDKDNLWCLYLRKTATVPRCKFTSIPAAITYLLNNPI